MTPLLSAMVITGPTAAGKSAVALQIAAEFNAVILSCDAMQVYRGMTIGTASPNVDELKAAPHFGVDVVHPTQGFSAADFVTLGRRVLQNHDRVLVVGGTSLYLRALVRGLAKTPPFDPDLRAQLLEETGLYERLTALDPTLAARLHPNDTLRVVRGLEVVLSGGVPLSVLQETHAAQPDEVATDGLWLDQESLYDRIDQRVLTMMKAGYLEEVQTLLDKGYARELKPMLSLGYRHLCDHLIDGLDLDEAVRRTQRDTRHFSRKQRNWMKQLGYPKVVGSGLDEARAAAKRIFGRKVRTRVDKADRSRTR
jgi:tRNA dimethylallyltransferase